MWIYEFGQSKQPPGIATEHGESSQQYNSDMVFHFNQIGPRITPGTYR
jgi:hypothetical protein